MYNQIDSNKRKTLLLIIIFLVVIIALGWFVGIYLNYGYGILILSIIISIAMSLTGYFKGDKIALKSVKAKPIEKKDNPYVYRMVENLSITAGTPMPKVYIIDSPALNAFATGRDPKHASIALTKGIIQELENEELEGVIAHELSHVKNYDIRLMTIVVVLVGTIAMLSDIFIRSRLYGNKRSSNSNGKMGGIIMIVGIVLLILSPLIAQIIKLAISRKREFLADASGALLTRYPEGLAKALEKISTSKATLDSASSATAHMFISNPLKNKQFSKLFSTHPPALERIAKLRSM